MHGIIAVHDPIYHVNRTGNGHGNAFNLILMDLIDIVYPVKKTVKAVCRGREETLVRNVKAVFNDPVFDFSTPAVKNHQFHRLSS